jgi:uncharacterized membrane protein YesL
MQDTPLRRLLERIADLTIIGLLTLVCCVGVVTGLAGLTAATATVAGQYGPGPLPHRFLRAFRQSWRGTIGPQLAWLLLLAVGAGDVAFALRSGAGTEYPAWLLAPALACGVLLLAAAAVMPTYLAIVQIVAPSPMRIAVRRAAAMAGGMPLTTLTIGTTLLVVTVIGTTLPVLAPLLIGTHVLISLTAVQAATRRIAHSHRHRPSTRPRTVAAAPR